MTRFSNINKIIKQAMLNTPRVLTSMMVPLVITPNDVNNGDVGFFFTPMRGKQNVAFNSGCVTCAFLNRSAFN